MELGTLELDLKGSIKNSSGELEGWPEENRKRVLTMLEDSGALLGSDSFRRLVVAYTGYEYLITITRDSILVLLREN
ncbi:unnamed protein product [Blepharisma stoltei]|uniref:Uncharacterized protein n=1 Tax=Blepharisma stoltei TaxID=1481888 RepID=A0AAU9KJE3_9CILI|nr:unnamed protein product [Blepharisma stoltei]